MLTGKALGKAIATAIDRKIAAGVIKSKTDVANDFGVRPSSVHGWIKTGAISKDKLQKLWDYFADVAGPEHWGLSAWPSTYTRACCTTGEPRAAEYNALTERQRALLGLFAGLTEGQQTELLRRAEAQKQSNDALIEELVQRRTHTK